MINDVPGMSRTPPLEHAKIPLRNSIDITSRTTTMMSKFCP